MRRGEKNGIKKCPFCGDDDVTLCFGYTNSAGRSTAFCECSYCHARGPVLMVQNEEDEQTVVNMWNKPAREEEKQ